MTPIQTLLALRLDNKRPCETARDWLATLPVDTTLQQIYDLCPQGDWLCWWWAAASAPITRAEVWPAILPEIEEPYMAWAKGTKHEGVLEQVGAAIESGDENDLRVALNAASAATSDAAHAAKYAAMAVWDAAWVAGDARYVAWAARTAAAHAAAWAAVRAAWASAMAATWAARAAARDAEDAAWAAAHQRIANRIRAARPTAPGVTP